jgi:hypothetical protein
MWFEFGVVTREKGCSGSGISQDDEYFRSECDSDVAAEEAQPFRARRVHPAQGPTQGIHTPELRQHAQGRRIAHSQAAQGVTEQGAVAGAEEHLHRTAPERLALRRIFPAPEPPRQQAAELHTCGPEGLSQKHTEELRRSTKGAQRSRALLSTSSSQLSVSLPPPLDQP